MKKDKETRVSSFWKKGRLSSVSFKKLFFGSIISIIFILSIFILIHRHINKTIPKNNFSFQPLATVPELAPTPAPVPEPRPIPNPEAALLQSEIDQQNNRLAQLENNLFHIQSTAQSSHQLVAFELLQEILEGHLPIGTLTLYLQKSPEPWTTDILNTLVPITECKSYTQLKILLALPPSGQSLSLGQRIKNVLNSFIRIRKLDAEGHPTLANLDEIRMALQVRNVQQALEAFDRISPDEQAQLSEWKRAAQDRLTLETIKTKILLELSGVNQ